MNTSSEDHDRLSLRGEAIELWIDVTRRVSAFQEKNNVSSWAAMITDPCEREKVGSNLYKVKGNRDVAAHVGATSPAFNLTRERHTKAVKFNYTTLKILGEYNGKSGRVSDVGVKATQCWDFGKFAEKKALEIDDLHKSLQTKEAAVARLEARITPLSEEVERANVEIAALKKQADEDKKGRDAKELELERKIDRLEGFVSGVKACHPSNRINEE